MASNFFGNIFHISTWGETHGKAIGVCIDGCPAGIEISEDEIYQELKLRRPGQTPYTSPRSEEDKPEILSGVFEGKTTGAPISILIHNKDVDSNKYEPIKDLLRPGHANYTYLHKYGIFDYRGGGRSSARETACRVAAGVLAKKLLTLHEIALCAYIKEIGGIASSSFEGLDPLTVRSKTLASPVFCPDSKAAQAMMEHIETAKADGDSLGGIIELISSPLPVGLGDPVYEKLEANLAKAMLTIPATKGFEIGSGFAAARMRGSEHNDSFIRNEQGLILTKTNHAGGTLGGISNGMPLLCRVAFKPTSSIKKVQETVNLEGEKRLFHLPEGSRHDPCVTIRAVPIVEAMGALVLADALLMNRSSHL